MFVIKNFFSWSVMLISEPDEHLDYNEDKPKKQLKEILNLLEPLNYCPRTLGKVMLWPKHSLCAKAIGVQMACEGVSTC